MLAKKNIRPEFKQKRILKKSGFKKKNNLK